MKLKKKPIVGKPGKSAKARCIEAFAAELEVCRLLKIQCDRMLSLLTASNEELAEGDSVIRDCESKIKYLMQQRADAHEISVRENHNYQKTLK